MSLIGSVFERVHFIKRNTLFFFFFFLDGTVDEPFEFVVSSMPSPGMLYPGHIHHKFTDINSTKRVGL